MDVEFTVVEDLDKDTLRVRGVDGNTFRVHKARIKKVIREIPEDVVPVALTTERPKPQEPNGQVTEEPKGQTDTKPRAEAKPEKEERKMGDKEEAVAVATKPKAEKAKKLKAKKPKAEKAKREQAAPKKELVAFNVKDWAKGILLSKAGKFDHPKFKLVSYVSVDAKEGFYHTINTYRYPNGVETLGKKNMGGNKYPLVNHQMTIKIKTKAGGTATRVIKGTKSAEELVAFYQKKGYKQV